MVVNRRRPAVITVHELELLDRNIANTECIHKRLVNTQNKGLVYLCTRRNGIMHGPRTGCQQSLMMEKALGERFRQMPWDAFGQNCRSLHLARVECHATGGITIIRPFPRGSKTTKGTRIFVSRNDVMRKLSQKRSATNNMRSNWYTMLYQGWNTNIQEIRVSLALVVLAKRRRATRRTWHDCNHAVVSLYQSTTSYYSFNLWRRIQCSAVQRNVIRR